MTTLKDAIALSESAVLQAENKESNPKEAFAAAYAKFESLEQAAADKTEVLTHWGIAITNHLKVKGINLEEADKLFESANQKFETALSTAKADAAPKILTHWGNLLHTQALRTRDVSGRAGFYSKAAETLQDAFSRDPQPATLQSWIDILRQQSSTAEGNQRFWFESQIAEKTKWLDKLNNNEPIDLSAKTELSPNEKLKKGAAEKEQGNDFFKRGEFTNALKHYHNALNFANGLYGLPPLEEKILKELKGSIYNNMAVVHMKQGKNDRAIADLKQVLDLDANNVKALFRRGKLWLTFGDVDKSRADLTKAKELDPTNKEILQELQLLEKKEKAQSLKQKQFYSKMFD